MTEARTYPAAPAQRALLISAILASALGYIDSTVIALALPAMRNSLGASLQEAQWIASSYLVVLAALVLTGGALADRFGLARIFGGGIALFVLASILCAMAPTAPTLIAARAVKGFGAALMVPGSLMLIARAYPPEARSRAIGLWAASAAVTTGLGPVIAGLVLTLGGDEMWRAIFWINLPLGAIALWCLLRHLPPNEVKTTAQPPDILGAFLAILSLGALALALTDIQGPTRLWALIGLVSLTAFVSVEARRAHAMMPLSLFANRAFSATNAVTLILYFGFATVIYFLPMTVISAWGAPEINAAAAFAPLSVFIALLSPRMGRIAGTHGPAWPMAGGALLVTIAHLWLIAALPSGNFWWGLMPPMVLSGIGMACVVAPLSATLIASVAETKTGVASGINNAIARIASLLAVAAMGTLAGIAYRAAKGPMSFGATATDAAHVAASNAALATLLSVTAALSCVSALIAWLWLPRTGLSAPRPHP